MVYLVIVAIAALITFSVFLDIKKENKRAKIRVEKNNKRGKKCQK